MNNITCVRCKKNPAVVFVSSPDGDASKTLGYCIKCACELNLGPVKQMMDAMGVTPMILTLSVNNLIRFWDILKMKTLKRAVFL